MVNFRRICSGGVLSVVAVFAYAQSHYGTTGLMNMPTGEMQRDKTFMFGGNFLSKYTTVPRWWYDTWNYYINVTFFPWMEVGYMCALHKAVPTDYGNRSGYWVPSTYYKFVNQDRSFHFRLRLWKEGWWRSWTPQVVLGSNDAIGDSSNGGSLTHQAEQSYGNGFWTRYYLAMTKHLVYENWGKVGVHVAWIYSRRFDNKLNNPAIGIDFQPTLKDDDWVVRNILNRLKLMTEVVPGYTSVKPDLTFDEDQSMYQLNCGLYVSLWRDYMNVTVELDKGRFFSAGVQFKVHLK